ncbi:TnsD family Tn7-like transposition protein [Nostoc sp. WHI]|uniref:TnsD family Tn7-like transposition protein n=1 Tax=Nostoc sp. WHI TaxID=2650611 RepID=UPI001E5F75D2|nr:TnsD family Tn7-like transposition protein [Nostoc sp. WHI]
MLSFFPILYPDELLYSGLARYHIRSGNRSFKQTDLELFGYSSQQVCKVTLTNNLNHLVNNLSLLSQQTINNLLQKHTLYPFYAILLMPQEAWLLKSSMSKKINESILEVAKMTNGSGGNSTKYLKFCHSCVGEDTQKYGEPYWHRLHQIPGVIVCPIHRIPLNNSLVPIETKEIHYHAPSDDNCPLNTGTTIYNDATLQKLLVFANDIEWLINNNFTFQGLSWLRSQYKTYLTNKNFITVFSKDKFIFHEQEFYNAVLAYYGQDFLEAINPKRIKNPDKYLSNCLLACDLNPVIDRVMHILIIKFLANSIEDFFKAQ